jgi:hypothetical protein
MVSDAVLLGEVRTCLLRNSSALPHNAVSELLQLVSGERVRISERPIAYAASPDQLTGLDCRLPAASGSRCRGIGTASAHAVVTGGRVLQGSTVVQVERGADDRRQRWSHYLARPGVMETTGRFAPDDLARGFLADLDPVAVLDLGAISERLIGAVQRRPQLDHVLPMRAARTRLRWAARVSGSGSPARTVSLTADAPMTCDITVVDRAIRAVTVAVPAELLGEVAAFCEDLALHDWALTVLVAAVERAGQEPGRVEALARLEPAIEHLMHLWMPGAHVSRALRPLWADLERDPGFTRQWTPTVARIRDQLTLHMMAVLRNP